MAEKSTTIRCPTPRCVANIEKYGEAYHMVYEIEPGSKRPQWPEECVAFCERCGGWFDGTTWHHKCAMCGIEVAPGELTGLFVPHKCKACEQKTAEADMANGAVCRMCHQPFSRCCC